MSKFQGNRKQRRAHVARNPQTSAIPVRRDGDLLSYVHPTKGYRSRRYPRYLPYPASKQTLAAVSAMVLMTRAKRWREFQDLTN